MWMTYYDKSLTVTLISNSLSSRRSSICRYRDLVDLTIAFK